MIYTTNNETQRLRQNYDLEGFRDRDAKIEFMEMNCLWFVIHEVFIRIQHITARRTEKIRIY